MQMRYFFLGLLAITSWALAVPVSETKMTLAARAEGNNIKDENTEYQPESKDNITLIVQSISTNGGTLAGHAALAYPVPDAYKDDA
ncbi:hypothetical protein MMC14_007273 [Varicellaria rhodocarpa]|nr:hypothetical protein [Varicellaria rhodocarpa]